MLAYDPDDRPDNSTYLQLLGPGLAADAIDTAEIAIVLQSHGADNGDPATTNWFSFVDTMGDLTGSPWTAGSVGGFSLDLANLPGGEDLSRQVNALDDADQVESTLRDYYDQQIEAAIKMETMQRIAA